MKKRKVIIITDGDETARASAEVVARKVGGRCISLSGTASRPLTGKEIVELIIKAPKEPIFVMVDDKGLSTQGMGERILTYIARHPAIEVLGVVAVASNTKQAEGTPVDVSITKTGEKTQFPVDKYGNALPNEGLLKGDTVDVLKELNIPIVVGTGDTGKQDGADDLRKDAPVTLEAVEEILRRSGFLNDNN
ncbi:MAG: stage V sporulation protein AE [Clostridia bacterium]|nr:stage V sporulation protein AE [Clostridia bacterium]